MDLHKFNYISQQLESHQKLIAVSKGQNLEKIKKLYQIKKDKNLKFDIEVDGGINFSNSKEVITAGANILVSGTTIFKENNGDIKKNIETLKSM